MTQDPQTLRQHTLDVVQAYHLAWRERNLEKILGCFHADVEYHDFFQSRVFTQENIRAYIASSLPAVALVHIAPIRADGDTAFMEYSISIKGQEGLASFHSSEFITVKDGRIWRIHEYATLSQNDSAQSQSAPSATLSRLGLSPRQIANMSQDVCEYLQQPSVLTESALNLQQVANATGYSRNQLSYLFNQVLGSRFLQYLNEQRIHWLLNKLQFLSVAQAQDSHSLEALAFEAGFNSHSVFYKYFRNVTGQTPKQYWKQISARARS